MSSWGDLSDSQKAIYTAFYAPVENNERTLPSNNDQIPLGQCTPTEALINAVSDTGDELVRTINFCLNDGQYNAIQDWVREHGTNAQRGRLAGQMII